MLLDKEIEIKWHHNNKEWYTNKGYEFTKYKNKFLVKQKDITRGSNIRLELICDYCGSKFTKSASDYYISIDKQLVNKDACEDCKVLKTQDTMNVKYGVKHHSQVKSFTDKVANKRRKPIEDVRSLFNEYNYKLITAEYKNTQQRLQYICLNHEDYGVQEVSYGNLKYFGSSCAQCKEEERMEKHRESYKMITEEKGFQFVDIYRNDKGNLRVQYVCPNHLEKGVQDSSTYSMKKKMYQKCPQCSREEQGMLKRIDKSRALELFNEKGYKVLNPEDYQDGSTRLKYICSKHEELGAQETHYFNLKYANTCKGCISDSISKDNHYYWKGGITPLHNYLRERLYGWKLDSLKFYEFRCFISGQKENLIVHHVYNFSSILNEALEKLNLEVRDAVNKYTDNELKLIERTVIDLHYMYGLGIPMTEDLHHKFHSKYGLHDNTYEQIIDFKEEYENREIVGERS